MDANDSDPLEIVDNPDPEQRAAFRKAYDNLPLEESILLAGRDPEAFKRMTRFEDGRHLQVAFALPPVEELRKVEGLGWSDETLDLVEKLQQQTP